MKSFEKMSLGKYKKLVYLKNTIIAFIITSFILGANFSTLLPASKEVQAATNSNLINDGSFEGNISDSWTFWQGNNSSRSYEFYRSTEPSLGQGSFSGAVSAVSGQDQAFNAGLVTKDNKSFSVDSNKTYRLSFYAKSTWNFKLISYIQRADNFGPTSDLKEDYITSDWKKYSTLFKPKASTKTLLTFVVSEMPAGTVLNLDGVELIEMNVSLNTKEVKGKIGELNKSINLSNSNAFNASDIQIELPYFDSSNNQITSKIFNPKKIENSNAYFDMREKTFSGIAKVYVNEVVIGTFDYNVLPQISEFNPSLARVNEDLVVYGSGFNPIKDSTFLIVNRRDLNGKNYEDWIPVSSLDSKLSQASFKMPTGLISGNLKLNTVFYNQNKTNTQNRSNGLDYKVKPVITNIGWSKKGYEMVGDNLKISGLGLVNSPKVNFYDGGGKKLDSKSAKVISLNSDYEVIEVATTDKLNTLKLTVEAGGVESDLASAQSYSAMSKISSLGTKNSRTDYANQEKIPAAISGEEISFSGNGLKASNNSVIAEFQGFNKKITVNIPNVNSNFDQNGTWVKAGVPAGAQTGYVNLVVNGQKSNSLYLEIIPKIIEITPNPILPGNPITMVATGVGNNIDLANITFYLNDKDQVQIKPTRINVYDNETYIYLTAPLSISNKTTKVGLEYDRWKDSQTQTIIAQPHINSASLDLDTKILVIKGYGFSSNLKENKITYKYADENKTIITPKISELGVFTTEDGQEIRIRLLDDYHYGFVSLKIGAQESNEVNFGPMSIRKITRRIEFVKSLSQTKGVLYISGYNFGNTGGVMVGNQWADVHYRSNYFIIAIVDQGNVSEPVIIARQ